MDGGLGYDVLDGGDGDDLLRDADGLPDRIACGPGSDRVEADTTDVVAGDCEVVTPRGVVPAGGSPADDRTAPRIQVGGSDAAAASQAAAASTCWRRRASAASSPPPASSTSAGSCCRCRADRKRVTVAGGGAELTIRLTHGAICGCAARPSAAVAAALDPDVGGRHRPGGQLAARQAGPDPPAEMMVTTR